MTLMQPNSIIEHLTGLAQGNCPSADGQPSVSRLLSRTIGDAHAILKGAARTARLLEEQFIWEGWSTGRIYGSEIDLAKRYGVGRTVVRAN